MNKARNGRRESWEEKPRQKIVSSISLISRGGASTCKKKKILIYFILFYFFIILLPEMKQRLLLENSLFPPHVMRFTRNIL